jgi:hypothetical protein
MTSANRKKNGCVARKHHVITPRKDGNFLRAKTVSWGEMLKTMFLGARVARKCAGSVRGG